MAVVAVGCLLAVYLTPEARHAYGAPPARPAVRHPDGAAHYRHAARATSGLDVRAENSRPGTSAWRRVRAGPPGAMEGFADRVSVLPGRPFRLYASTTAGTFGVTAYRMGWYGGRQGRAVWRSGRLPGRRQAAPKVSAATRTVTAPWRPSLTVRTTGWPPGMYLLVLTSARGYGTYVPLTVRSPSARGRTVLVNAVTTWEAYNTWGGRSLYTGPGGYAGRSRAVSFDRPYDPTGRAKILVYDRPAVAFAERQGIPLAYETDIELSRHPGAFAGSRAVISLGHDEYWDAAMRGTATRLRDAGTNLAFLGANAIFRHIRLAATALGPDRLIICYKSAAEDPLGHGDPARATQDWRDPPDPRPENVLTGAFYQCNPVSAPLVVYRPHAWLLAGTHTRAGSSFASLVGPEYDRAVAQPPPPRPIEVLTHSPLVCGGIRSYADATYYTTHSGAGVFDAGTMRWVCALAATHRTGCGGVTASGSRFARQVTHNLLRAFQTGPAGRAHPAHDDLRAAARGGGTPPVNE